MYGHHGQGRWLQGGTRNTRGAFQSSQGNIGFYANQNQQFHGRQGGGPHQTYHHGAHRQNNGQYQGMQQQNAPYRGQPPNRPYRGMQQRVRSYNQENVHHGLSNTIPVHVNQRTDNTSGNGGDERQNVSNSELEQSTRPPGHALLSIELQEWVPSITKDAESPTNSTVCQYPPTSPGIGGADIEYTHDEQAPGIGNSPELNLKSARIPETSQGGSKSSCLDKVYSDTRRNTADSVNNRHCGTREHEYESRHHREPKHSVSEASISKPYHEDRKWERDYRERGSNNGDQTSSKHHGIRSSSESSRSSKNLDEHLAADSYMYFSRSSSERHSRNSQKDSSRNCIIRSSLERNIRNFDEESARNHYIRYSSEKTSRNLDQESARNHAIRYSPERSRRNLDEESFKDYVTRSSVEGCSRKLDESSPEKHCVRYDLDEGSSRTPAFRSSPETGSRKGGSSTVNRISSKARDVTADSFRFHVNRSREKSYDNRHSSSEPVRTSSYGGRSRERPDSNSSQHEKYRTYSCEYIHTLDTVHRLNVGSNSDQDEENCTNVYDYTHNIRDITIHHSYARPSEERFVNATQRNTPLGNEPDKLHHRRHYRHDHNYPQHWQSEDDSERNANRYVNADADRQFAGQCQPDGESRERKHASKLERVLAKTTKVDDCTSPPQKVTKVRYETHENSVHPKDHSVYTVHPRNRKSNVLKDDKPIHQSSRKSNVQKDEQPVKKRTEGSPQKKAVKKQEDGKPNENTASSVMRHNVPGRGAYSNSRNYIDCSSHGRERTTPPYQAQGQQSSWGGRGRTVSGRGMNNYSRCGFSPVKTAGVNSTVRGVTPSSSLRQAEERARRPRHNRGNTRRGMNGKREPTSVPQTQGAVEAVFGGGQGREWSMPRGLDFSQADVPIPQAANRHEQKPVHPPTSNTAALGAGTVHTASSHTGKLNSTQPRESSINELLNDLPEEESDEQVKSDLQNKDSFKEDENLHKPSSVTDVKTIKTQNSEVDKLESKLKGTVLENSPTTADAPPCTPDNHTTTPDDGSDDEFDLEEIEVVPTLSQGQGQSEGSSGVVVKEEDCNEEEEEDVGEYVEKGLQNLRDMFKGRMSPASSCSGIDPLGDDDSDKESAAEMKSPQPQPGSSSSVKEGDLAAEKKPTKSAWKPGSFSQDSDDYVFDVAMSDDDEESDDDDLLDAPSILQIKKPAATSMVKSKPLITPSGSEDEAEAQPAPKADPSDVFSLDTLLTEREQKEETDRQFAEMEAELQKDIRSGGIRNLAAEATDEMMADHRLQLKQMELVEQVIRDHHPGDLVFDPVHYERTFSYPGSLTLQSCGFIPGSSQIDKHLSTLEPELIAEMLTSEVIEMCFCAISTPHAFLTWLFQLISVHENRLVVQQSHAIIYRVLRQTNNKATDWVPSLATIKRVFVNMGADEAALCRPRANDVNKNKVKSESGHQGAAAGVSAAGGHQGAAPGGDVPHVPHDVTRTYKLENLRLVMNAISDAVHLRSSCYKVNDLVSIMVMVFKVSLDKRLNQQTLDYDISTLLSSLLYAIPTDDWPDKVVELCHAVPTLSAHHHNMLHMVTLLPPCDRGRYLQRRLAYSVLLHVYNKQLTRESVTNFKLHHLHPLMAEVTIKGEEVDYYLISTAISLVDSAVGNEDLASREKNDLVMLMNILKSKMSDVRESINIIDRTMVKDQMVRLCSKWTFLLQNMGSSERTIFAYTTVSEPVKIEPVVTRDHADSDPEELDSIPME